MMPARGFRGHGRGVHSFRCLPSHLPDMGEAVESRHSPVLMLLDVFDGDVDACTTVSVAFMLALTALAMLFVVVRSLRVSSYRALLARVFWVNPR